MEAPRESLRIRLYTWALGGKEGGQKLGGSPKFSPHLLPPGVLPLLFSLLRSKGPSATSVTF